MPPRPGPPVPPARPPSEARELEASLDRAMREHGPFTSVGEFRARALDVARRRAAADPTAGAGDRLERWLPPYLADLHLADACARHPRVDPAWHVLIACCGERLHDCARRFGEGESEVSAFLADLWLERRGGRNLLSTFQGLAPLASWLVLVMRRRLARVRRAEPRRAAWDDEPTTELGPDERVAHLEFAAELAVWLHRSLESLSPRDRDLVEARVLTREVGVETARRHGVSPSYVSRRYREVLTLLRGRLTPLLDRFDVDPRSLG